MSLLTVRVCTGRSCSERFSEFIYKRLDADREFYQYGEDVELEKCLCHGRCQEGPTVVFGGDTQVRQNPIKASEMLKKKVAEARKKLHTKNTSLE